MFSVGNIIAMKIFEYTNRVAKYYIILYCIFIRYAVL